MATVLEILDKSTAHLKSKGVPDPRLDAQHLLAHALGLKRLDLYLQFDRPLTETELEQCRSLLRRRSQREPLQYILGHTEFRQLKLACDARALIPRPETEWLVEEAIKRLRGRAGALVADIGIGAGPICLSLMKETPELRVVGSDLSDKALSLCRENAAANGLPEPELYQGDLISAFPSDMSFSALISNPPYVPKTDLAGLQPEVRDFEPVLALDGGPEGWELPWRLIQTGWNRLLPGGFMLLEIHPPTFSRLKSLAADLGEVQGLSDLENENRFILVNKADS
jgi:release factor glutamine methyltransferase